MPEESDVEGVRAADLTAAAADVDRSAVGDQPAWTERPAAADVQPAPDDGVDTDAADGPPLPVAMSAETPLDAETPPAAEAQPESAVRTDPPVVAAGPDREPTPSGVPAPPVPTGSVDEDARDDGPRQDLVAAEPGPPSPIAAEPGPTSPEPDPASSEPGPVIADPASTSAWWKRPRLVAVLAVALVAVVAVGLLRWAPWSGLPEDAAFRVGDDVVTEAAVQRRTDVLRALYGLQVPEDDATLDRFRRDTAKAMAISAVLDDVARDEGIAIADKTVSDALDRFLLQRYPEGGRAAYVQALTAQGVGEQDVLAEIRRQLEVRDLFDRTTKGVDVSDDEVRALFDAAPDTYAQQEQRQLRHIVVADEALAQAVLRRLRGGQDFAAAAAQVSLDGSTKGKGGDLGLLTAAELDPAFGAAAFAVAPGALFGPVQTSLGWHVGMVDRVVPAAPTTFEQVRGQLREQQQVEQSVAVWRDFIVDRVEQADVEYAPDYRPADPRPDVGVPQQPGASPPSASPPS